MMTSPLHTPNAFPQDMGINGKRAVNSPGELENLKDPWKTLSPIMNEFLHFNLLV